MFFYGARRGVLRSSKRSNVKKSSTKGENDTLASSGAVPSQSVPRQQRITIGADGRSSDTGRLYVKRADVERLLAQRLSQRCLDSVLTSAPLYTGGLPGYGEESEPDLFARGVSAQREDARYHRRLSHRFTSLCDQEKCSDPTEIPFDTVERDVRLRLRWSREAVSLLRKYLKNQQIVGMGSRPRVKSHTLPQRVVFLVLYSHSRHAAAVGRSMKRIRDVVKTMLSVRHEEVLGVVTVCVGVNWRDLSIGDGVCCEAEGDTTAKTHAAAEPQFEDDVLWYPKAGLYTFNALLQCLCRVDSKNDEGTAGRAYLSLHRRVLIISDGWFHVRTSTLLHHDISVSSGRHDTFSIEPMPFVLGPSHSEEEVNQFARYTACRALA
ncbi:hypothetical protein TRVL_02632 [Trypanosoma vivax]|nr:hypothetical protein TRVL_02632 [Trypanosoma vivax]